MGFIAIKGDKVAPQLGVTPIEESKALGKYKRGGMGLFVGYTTVGLLGAGLAIAFFISSSVPFIGWIFVGLAVIALFALTAWIEKKMTTKYKNGLCVATLAPILTNTKPKLKKQANSRRPLPN